jgi:hypothetical protein
MNSLSEINLVILRILMTHRFLLSLLQTQLVTLILRLAMNLSQVLLNMDIVEVHDLVIFEYLHQEQQVMIYPLLHRQ